MSKGSRRRTQQVSHGVMSANWMEMFGDKWECRSLDGEVIATESTYEKARDAGLGHFPPDDDFAVIKVRG